ncbi:hypothetical protein [Tateyamaria pelophila]|uniref:hypothetical protein n=1 Tax=Tateyamaria pelophila TaxID=328415 RepID=UPI001CC021F0|nr:hypothetical protein [Tateyamaria pelophila]
MIEILFHSAGVSPRYTEHALPIIGLLAGLVSIFAFAPYVRDTLALRTQPQRASWFIWSVLSSITLCSQIYEGATSSLWFVAIQAASTVFIFILSISRGTGSLLNASDACMLIAAGIGVLLWIMTDTTAYALAIVIAVSSLGGVATIKKAYRDPGSETMSTWVMSFCASALAVLAVGEPSWVLLAYPVYLFVLYGVIVLATKLGHTRKAELGMAPIVWQQKVGF